jgi:hypothetical protein
MLPVSYVGALACTCKWLNVFVHTDALIWRSLIHRQVARNQPTAARVGGSAHTDVATEKHAWQATDNARLWHGNRRWAQPKARQIG